MSTVYRAEFDRRFLRSREKEQIRIPLDRRDEIAQIELREYKNKRELVIRLVKERLWLVDGPKAS